MTPDDISSMTLFQLRAFVEQLAAKYDERPGLRLRPGVSMLEYAEVLNLVATFQLLVMREPDAATCEQLRAYTTALRQRLHILEEPLPGA